MVGFIRTLATGSLDVTKWFTEVSAALTAGVGHAFVIGADHAAQLGSAETSGPLRHFWNVSKSCWSTSPSPSKSSLSHHVDVGRHNLPFHQPDVPLSTQIPKYLANFPAKPSKKDLLAVFWKYHNVVLALPLHVGLTLPVFHDGPPRPTGPSSWGDRLSKKRRKRQSRWISVDYVLFFVRRSNPGPSENRLQATTPVWYDDPEGIEPRRLQHLRAFTAPR